VKKNIIYALLGLLFFAQKSFAVVEGAPYVCVGYHGWYSASSGITGGTWSTSNTAVATINASTGVSLAIAPGTVTISYTTTSGTETLVTTVDPVPAPITGGPTTFYIGETATFSDAVPGGTWSSTNTAVATVGSSTGIVTGVGNGIADIHYDMGGCGYKATITVTFPAGVENLTTPHISTYPNPTTGKLNLNWGAAIGEAIVTISDITGHKVYDAAINMAEDDGNKMLDLSSLTNGLYIVNIRSESVNYNSKLEIQK
jgi:hypothetical protein